MRVREWHGIALEREEQEVMHNGKREEVDVKRTKGGRKSVETQNIGIGEKRTYTPSLSRQVSLGNISII